MANYNLTGQKIKNTYDQLAQVSGSLLVDGLGNPTTISASNIDNFTTEVSKSAAASGFGEGGGGVSEAVFTAYTSSNDSKVDALIAATSSYLTEVPSGTISSSAQVDLSQASGTAVSASHAITASFALNAGGDTEWDNIQNKPSGLVSGSSQVSYNGITDVPSGLVSGSSQVDYNGISNVPSGLVSGSSQIDLSQATGTAANATSASYAVSASHLIGGGGSSAGLVAGTGTDSMRSSDDLTTTAASVNGPQSIGIGNAAIVSGTASLHISLDDSNTNSTGDQTINIGKDINNQNGYSTAIGHNLSNTGTGGNVLIGRSVTTAGDYSIGIGEGAQAQAQGGIAIGQGSTSSGNSVAIGQGSTMGSSYGFAGGYNARAGNDASIAIGGDVQANSNQAIAIGTDTNIDTNSQGAVALGQGIDVNTATNGIAIGKSATISGNESIGIGNVATSSYQSGIALGNGAEATSPYGIAIGDGAWNQNRDGNRSNYISIGRNANSSTNGIAIGYGAQARGSDNIVLGKSADATGFAAITIGNDTSLNDATRGILIGHNGSVNSGTSDAIVIGYNQSTTYTNEINIGGQIKYNDDNTGAVSFESAVRVDTTTLTGAGATVSVDASTSNYFYLNNAGSTTTIANPTNLQDGATYTFKIDDGRNITWGAAYKWPNGVVPTLSSGSDVISFVSIGGTNLYGTAQYNYQ